MTIPGEAEAVGWAAKNVLWLILVAVVVLALLYVGYAVFIAPQNARNAVAAANGNAQISAAGNASAHEAVQAVNANGQNEAHIHDATRIDHETIIHEPGASVPISDDLDAAGRRAVCMHDSAAGLPECQRLRQPGP